MSDRRTVIEKQISVKTKRARRGGLLAFTLLTKPDYEVNWHHKLTTNYLNKFIKKEIKRLIILEPPRYGKSELSSRRLPALLHGVYPNDEILAASYNGDLAADMTIDVQRIMDMESYQRIFPMTRITPANSKSNYARSSVEHELIPMENTGKLWIPQTGSDGKPIVFDESRNFIIPRGSYRAAGVGGSFTGRGGDWLLIDDPIKNRQDADSPAFRNELWDWYRSTLRTRAEKDASVCITLTTWHEDDLIHRLLKLARQDEDADQWQVLRLPAIKEGEDSWFKKFHLMPSPDPRKEGDALWPGKFSLSDLKATKPSVGTREWTALYQQRPTPEGGNLVQGVWLKRYKVPPTGFEDVLISCDMASKDKTSSDYYVYQAWGRKQADRYLLYQLRGRWAFPEACRKLIELVKMYPKARRKIIEAKANGPAVAQTLRKKITGIIEKEPDGDKVARLNAVTPEMESGNVWIPDENEFPWVHDFIDEMTSFPNGANDDQVDAASQALVELRKGGPVYAPTAGHGSGTVYE